MKCEWGCHNTLYRDPDNGKIAGVCAGIADYFSWDLTTVRIITIVSAVAFTVVTVGLYACAAWCLKPKPKNLYASKEQESYWRHYRNSPRDTLAVARNRFRRLEKKLNKLESYVTSKRYILDREFENIE